MLALELRPLASLPHLVNGNGHHVESNGHNGHCPPAVSNSASLEM